MNERDDSAKPGEGAELEPVGSSERDGKLEPARFDDPTRKRAFASKLPWKLIGAFALVVLLLVGVYQMREHMRANEVRDQIDATYATIQNDADEVRAFRRQIEDWVAEATQMPTDSWVDPTLKISELHDLAGLYLRIRVQDTTSRGSLATAAGEMAPDAITKCLGITPTSLRTLYRKGQFLTPEWWARVDESDDVLRLRVIEDELKRHTSRDLPILRELLEARYFLLILEHGNSRLDGPVSAFLWDLQRGSLRMRTRTEASGRLIPVRIQVAGAPAAPPRRKTIGSGAGDCSIAAHLKSLTGETPLTFSASFPPPNTAADETPTEEASPSAAPTEQASPSAAPPGGPPPQAP